LGALASSPHLGKLRVLRAWNWGVGEDVVRHLATLPALKMLVIGDSGLSAARLKALREEFRDRLRIV
jgi:hypothetical protein